MKQTESTRIPRRRLLTMAGLSAGVPLLVQRPLIAAASFGSLKQIDAGVLNVGYAEAGPADGRAVMLLHGWPYDIHSFVDVTPLLASAGCRVIVPHLRGHGAQHAFFQAKPSGTPNNPSSRWTSSP